MTGLPRRRRATSDDSGFGLLEVMVAMVILGVVGAGAASMLMSSLRSTSDDRSRVAASDLALRELEAVRAAFSSATLGPQSIALGETVDPHPLAGGAAGAPLVVDTVPYTVRRTAEWQAQGDTSGPCDGGGSGQLAYLRVSVVVTWPGMGRTVPVTSSTLMTPPLGTYNTGTGHVKVKVLDQANAPEEGTTVTLLNGSGAVVSTQSTATDGCAFLPYLPPATYSVRLSRTGYVDGTWNASPAQPVTVQANQVSSLVFSYAPAAPVTLPIGSGAAGVPVAPSTAVSIYNYALTTATHTYVVTAPGATKSANVYPYSDGVQAWVGDCSDADPAGYPGGSRGAVAVTAPATAVTAPVTGVPVQVSLSGGTATKVGLTVVAVHSTSGCPSTAVDPVDGTTQGEVVVFPVTTDAAGTARVVLPLGSWTFKVVGRTASGSWPTASFVAPASATLVNVPVVVT